MTAERRGWRIVVNILAVIGVLAILLGLVGAGVVGYKLISDKETKDRTAASESPFYAKPDSVPATPGTVIRYEPLEYSVVGGKGWRIIYTSINSAGEPVAVSGRVFLPNTPAPAGGRKILAFGHGTVGIAPQCAPSRSVSYIQTGWLEPALQQGWAVVTTDYLGLGIEGYPPTFLLGGQEARDIVNSVRALRAFPGASAGTEWIVAGSSQGGNSALWTAAKAASIAPELQLKAVAPAVPAAELAAIMTKQWQSVIGWAIGPYALATYKVAYPDRDYEAIISPAGKDANDSLIAKCVLADGVEGLVLGEITGPYFTKDPNQDPAWSASVREQTPPPPPAGMPMFLQQGEADIVVTAGSNALLQNQWCAKGVNIASLWLPGVNHQDTSVAAGAAMVEWAAARFAGTPAVSTCAFGVPAPVEPLPAPKP